MSTTQLSTRPNPITTGFAMFSMFFGAGNSVFPLALGQYAQGHTSYAMLGLLITAVAVPFMGLFTMMLFNGDYNDFFRRTGKIPGFIVACIILALLGPFGATPRCIALSYSTIQAYIPWMSLPVFSAVACGCIFLLTLRKNRLLDVLGYILTPVLLGSIAIILIKGFLSPEVAPTPVIPKGHVFVQGLKEGYQTMDLMGAFFFSSVIIACLKNGNWLRGNEKEQQRSLLRLAIRASLIGAGLLATTYFGFSYIAATHSENLTHVTEDGLLGAIAIEMLGPTGGIVASLAIAFACLTTAIALVTVSAEFVHKDMSRHRLSYEASLGIVLVLTFLVSTLDFHGIARLLKPILAVSYPALITLSVMNLLHKLYGFKPVKGPVIAVFVLSLTYAFFG